MLQTLPGCVAGRQGFQADDRDYRQTRVTNRQGLQAIRGYIELSSFLEPCRSRDEEVLTP